MSFLWECADDEEHIGDILSTCSDVELQESIGLKLKLLRSEKNKMNAEQLRQYKTRCLFNYGPRIRIKIDSDNKVKYWPDDRAVVLHSWTRDAWNSCKTNKSAKRSVKSIDLDRLLVSSAHSEDKPRVMDMVLSLYECMASHRTSSRSIPLMNECSIGDPTLADKKKMNIPHSMLGIPGVCQIPFQITVGSDLRLTMAAESIKLAKRWCDSINRAKG